MEKVLRSILTGIAACVCSTVMIAQTTGESSELTQFGQAAAGTGDYGKGLEVVRAGKWSGGFTVGYGILPKTEGVSGSSFAMPFTANIYYKITRSFYAGTGIGYVYSNSVSHNDYTGNISVSNHSIKLPLELGYRLFFVRDKMYLNPYAGFDLNFLVKSKMEMGTGKDKETVDVDIEDNFSANARLGVRLNLWAYQLGFAYLFYVGEKPAGSSGYPELSFGFCF